MSPLRFDQIGTWSEIKIEIVKQFASAYSKIFSSPKQRRFYHIYIDAFAGPGIHVSKTSGSFVPGSPMQVLQVTPAFKEYHFIDLDGDKVAALRTLTRDRGNVVIYPGDCNEILLQEVFPQVRYEHYRRALCLLDPYGLHLKWEVIRTAGTLRTIDMFLNFPVADINRNVLWRNPEGVDPTDIGRMTAYWGDDSWRHVAYTTRPTLFGEERVKADTRTIAEAFRDRLKQVAGFPFVPPPLPMKNSQGVIVYYLFFASQNATADRIIKAIFRKYGGRG